MTTTARKTRFYKWAVINTDTRRVMRDRTGRRAIFETREAARLAARTLGGTVVQRGDRSRASWNSMWDLPLAVLEQQARESTERAEQVFGLMFT